MKESYTIKFKTCNFIDVFYVFNVISEMCIYEINTHTCAFQSNVFEALCVHIFCV